MLKEYMYIKNIVMIKKDFSFFSLNIFKNKITCIIKHFKIKDS